MVFYNSFKPIILGHNYKLIILIDLHEINRIYGFAILHAFEIYIHTHIERERETYIGIKLSDEAGEVVVLEIPRQHVLGELGRRPDHETVAVSVPRHYRRRRRGLLFFIITIVPSSFLVFLLQDVVRFCQKRRRAFRPGQ